MWVQLLTETALGALTGYITNHTAIQSLFKPGGVIEQTRDDFAREAGALLEEQVLTETILLERLQEPAVQELLKDILESFLGENLPACLETVAIDDIDGAREQQELLLHTLLELLENNRDVLCVSLAKVLDVDRLLSEQQIQRLTQCLQQVMAEVLEKETVLDDYFVQWNEEVGRKSLAELELDELCHILIKNMARETGAMQELLERDFREALELSLKNAMQALNLEPILQQLDDSMERASIQDYFSISSREMKQNLEALLQAEAGRDLCRLLAHHILEMLRETDKPIGSLVPDSLRDKLEPFMQETLPFLVSASLNWVRDNREAIGHMLESAIVEVAEEVGSMRGNLLLQLKDSLMDQLLNSDETYVQIYEMLVTGENTQAATTMILQKIDELLQSQTPHTLVDSLLKNENAEAQIAGWMCSIFQKTLSSYGDDWLRKLFAWNPGSLHLVQQKDVLEQGLAKLLSESVFHGDMDKLSENLENHICGMPVGDLIPINKQTVSSMMQKMADTMPVFMHETLGNIPNRDLVTQTEKLLENWLRNSGKQWLQEQAKGHTLQELVMPLERIALDHSQEIIQGLIPLGVKATAGEISGLAEDQIKRLSNEEMLVLVEDFMGRELQPLNYLGAAMGAGVGATVGTGLAMAIPEFGMVPMAAAAGAMAGKMGLFGAVGYGTNCAAVKGLFWPYEPIGGVHWAQGVIPKQKEIFSHSLGQLVNRYVINPEILQQIILEQNETWNLMAERAVENPAIVEKIADAVLAQRRNISETAVTVLQQQGTEWMSVGMAHIGDVSLKLSEEQRYAVSNWAIQHQAQLDKWLQQWVSDKLTETRPLSEYISAEYVWDGSSRWLLNTEISSLDTLAEQILLSEKRPVDWLSEVQWNRVVDAAGNYAANHWFSADALERILKAVFRYGGGYITGLINRYGWRAIYGWAEHNLVDLLKQYQDLITQKVTELILSKLGLMMRMGFSMIQGDELVYKIVDRILNQKLPIFMTVQKAQLEDFVRILWQEHLHPVVEILLDGEGTDAIATALSNQGALSAHLTTGFKESLVIAGEQPVCTWGRCIHIKTITHPLQGVLQNRWEQAGMAAMESLRQPFVSMVAVVLRNVSLYRLTRGISTIPSISKIVFCSKWAETEEGVLLALADVVGKTTPKDWLDWSALTEEICREANLLLQDSHVTEWVSYLGNNFLYRVASEPNAWFPPTWRVHILRLVMPEILTILTEQGADFLSTINLAGLTEEQLKLMDSAHLEDVVRGFAQSYLTHIEKRGWFGAVFAIPGILLYLV